MPLVIALGRWRMKILEFHSEHHWLQAQYHAMITREEAGEQLITFGQMRKQMGMTEKAKRVKKKDQISDDQLLLFAL